MLLPFVVAQSSSAMLGASVHHFDVLHERTVAHLVSQRAAEDIIAVPEICGSTNDPKANRLCCQHLI